MQKTLEKQIGSFVERKDFFCFSKITTKKAAGKLNVFLIRYSSKTKRKTAKQSTEKCFRINL